MDSRQMKMTAMGVLLSSVFVITAEAQRGPRGPQDEAQRAAFEACLTENGLIRPERGMRPSVEDMTKLQACMTANGYERPAGPPHGMRPHGPPPDGVRPPGPPPGEDGDETEAVRSNSGRGSSGVSN
ncbi:MAG: hypothetical protein JNJ49_10040 [Bdellovibrionaceae bacterium]|nr:hypothetical protein [Pseudobdellovibrionaceae bacterium]